MKKDIILFVGGMPNSTEITESIQNFAKKEQRTFRTAVLFDSKKQKKYARLIDKVDIALSCDISKDDAITKALQPHQKEFLAVVARGDINIPHLQKIIPHVPYLRTPTTKSLDWATDKIAMRNRFDLYDKSITTPFMVVHDAKQATLKSIEEKVGFPLIVKPTGLEASLLVNVCYDIAELKKVLGMVSKKINSVHKKKEGRGTPRILVERLMEGDMYSLDAYINSRGRVYFCPLVHVKTGKSVGFDDFFGYQQLTPSTLQKPDIEAAEAVAVKSIHALGLRSVSAHIELFKTEEGWKIIEVGPRIGGFRHFLYKKSYGINHTMNDILIRIPEKPKIPKKVLGHSVILRFYAKKEGVLTKLNGVKKIQELESFTRINQNKKLGDRCVYAKNGGSGVIIVTLFNKDRSKLLADIRRTEKSLVIETK